MNLVIATTQVPFIRGGAEVHAEELRDALVAGGHRVDIVAIPFKWYPPERILDHMLACRLLDLTESCGERVDRVIGLKFPAYLVKHPNKVLWILHQHRGAYDLWGSKLGDLDGSPDGMRVRNAIRQADAALIPEARRVFANSLNVGTRLKNFVGIDSTVLYHPPRQADLFHCKAAEPYFFFPSRIGGAKRQPLVVEALALTSQPVAVRFCGAADESASERQLVDLIRKHRLQDRATILGHVSDSEKRNLYAHCLGVVYPPVDEDLGYVTLEAMLSSKPVITCSDSGGTLEFVRHGETGLVADPTPMSLAKAMDELWQDRRKAALLGIAGRDLYHSLGINWKNVIRQLLA